MLTSVSSSALLNGRYECTLSRTGVRAQVNLRDETNATLTCNLFPRLVPTRERVRHDSDKIGDGKRCDGEVSGGKRDTRRANNVRDASGSVKSRITKRPDSKCRLILGDSSLTMSSRNSVQAWKASCSISESSR